MKILKQMIKKNINEHKKIYILALTAMGIGMIIGGVCAFFINNGAPALNYDINTFFSAYTLEGANNTVVFLEALWNNIRTVILVFVSAFLIVTIPLVYVWIMIKGLKIGFSVVFLIKSYGLRGVLFGISSLFIQNVIFIPVLFCYCAIAIKFAIQSHKLRSAGTNREHIRRLYIDNFIIFLFFCFLAAVCAAVQAYILPVLIKPVCALFV